MTLSTSARIQPSRIAESVWKLAVHDDRAIYKCRQKLNLQWTWGEMKFLVNIRSFYQNQICRRGPKELCTKIPKFFLTTDSANAGKNCHTLTCVVIFPAYHSLCLSGTFYNDKFVFDKKPSFRGDTTNCNA